jgi:hypothetical protein
MADTIYILTNEAMPGLIKIGRTTNSVAQRMRELDQTGVPLPFACYYAARVENGALSERRLHLAFGDHRVRSSREFFRLDPFRAKAALEMAAMEDVTPRTDVIDSVEDGEAVQRATERREHFRFSRVGIQAGAMLTFARDATVTATVTNDREIVFEGETTSLSAAALKAIRRLGYQWKTVAGPDFWLFEEETLTERRRRLEEELE